MLGRTSSEVFVMLLFFASFLCLHFIFDLHFVVVLHLSMFFIHTCFSSSSLTLPWTIAGFLHPFYTFSPAHRRVIRDTFIFNHSVIFRSSATILSGNCLPTVVFYLKLLHRHWPALIKASLGAGSSSLKFAGLHTDPRNTDPAHLLVWSRTLYKKDWLHLMFLL